MSSHPSYAHEQVEGIASDLALTQEATDYAIGLAKRADYELPVNRSPTVVAAASIYFAGLMRNEKRTQQQVADAAGCSIVAIRDAYQELAEHERIETNSSESRSQLEPERSDSWFQKVRRWVR